MPISFLKSLFSKGTALSNSSSQLKTISDIATLVNLANTYQQASDITQTQAVCLRILELDSEHVYANHLLGSLYGFNGDLELAIKYIEKAISLKSDYAPAYCDLANIHVQTGAIEQAIAVYKKSIALDAKAINTHYNLAIAYAMKGELEFSNECLQNVIAINQQYLPATLQLGKNLLATGEIVQAITVLEQVYPIAQEHAEYLSLLSNLYQKNAQIDKAIELGDKAISLASANTTILLNHVVILNKVGQSNSAKELVLPILEKQPENTEARYIYACVLNDAEESQAAIKQFELVVQAEPDNAKAYKLLGWLYHQAEDFDDAYDNYLLALHHDPADVELLDLLSLLYINAENYQGLIDACQTDISYNPFSEVIHCNVATAYYCARNYELAEIYYLNALACNPEYPAALAGLGAVSIIFGEVYEGLAFTEKALKLEPENIAARSTYATLLDILGRNEEALAIHKKILEEDPTKIRAQFSIALINLKMGNFASAWDDYELRFIMDAERVRPFQYPEWQGEDLTGKTLLIYAEQGLGDEIMFSSCVKEIAAKTKKCMLECDPKVRQIFTNTFPEVEVYGYAREEVNRWQGKLADVDLQTAIGSLPRYLRKSWDDFPQHNGYLSADSQKMEYWQSRLQELGAGLKVGISWSGGSKKTRHYIRTIPLQKWAPIFAVPGVHFINLQYGNHEEEIAAVKGELDNKLITWQDALDDYAETAALVASLDLVISVQTTIIHLSGALNTPAWVMVPACPEWRYMHKGERMPWYSSVKLIRQSEYLDWDPVIDQIAKQLSALPKN